MYSSPEWKNPADYRIDDGGVQPPRASLRAALKPTGAPMRPLAILLLATTMAASMPASAADPKPEIARDPAPPQKTGVLHGLRTIPEACARLQGEFTGNTAEPYRFAVVRTSAACQPRARIMDAAKTNASAATGWILNDRIRVPSAACATRQAVVTVWRRPAAAKPPALDAQGRARIYLEESMRKARAGELAEIPAYAVSMSLEGAACR
jgi:hypothetical protein